MLGAALHKPSDVVTAIHLMLPWRVSLQGLCAKLQLCVYSVQALLDGDGLMHAVQEAEAWDAANPVPEGAGLQGQPAPAAHPQAPAQDLGLPQESNAASASGHLAEVTSSDSDQEAQEALGGFEAVGGWGSQREVLARAAGARLHRQTQVCVCIDCTAQELWLADSLADADGQADIRANIGQAPSSVVVAKTGCAPPLRSMQRACSHMARLQAESVLDLVCGCVLGRTGD